MLLARASKQRLIYKGSAEARNSRLDSGRSSIFPED